MISKSKITERKKYEYLERESPHVVNHIKDHFEIVSVDGEVVGYGAVRQESGAESPDRQT